MEINIIPIPYEMCNMSFTVPIKNDEWNFTFTPVRNELMLRVAGKIRYFETLREMENFIKNQDESVEFIGQMYYMGFMCSDTFECHKSLNGHKIDELKYVKSASITSVNTRVLVDKVKKWLETNQIESVDVYCKVSNFTLKEHVGILQKIRNFLKV